MKLRIYTMRLSMVEMLGYYKLFMHVRRWHIAVTNRRFYAFRKFAHHFDPFDANRVAKSFRLLATVT